MSPLAPPAPVVSPPPRHRQDQPRCRRCQSTLAAGATATGAVTVGSTLTADTAAADATTVCAAKQRGVQLVIGQPLAMLLGAERVHLAPEVARLGRDLEVIIRTGPSTNIKLNGCDSFASRRTGLIFDHLASTGPGRVGR
jgi:hypothetical protein